MHGLWTVWILKCAFFLIRRKHQSVQFKHLPAHAGMKTMRFCSEESKTCVPWLVKPKYLYLFQVLTVLGLKYLNKKTITLLVNQTCLVCFLLKLL